MSRFLYCKGNYISYLFRGLVCRMKLLQILIPTYNRDEYLDKNIRLLCTYIRELEYQKTVGIVISDNASPDHTEVMLEAVVKENRDVDIQWYTQSKNVGLEKNALYVLEVAKANYVMYMGDDDYITSGYLQRVVETIERERLYLIIPTFYPIDTEGKKIEGAGRDLNGKTKIFPPGKVAVARLAYKAHQLSGVVFRREGLLDNYRLHSVDSIYLFIYFACVCALNGRSMLLAGDPVAVTQPPQHKKDWGYGKDGLLEEKFKCYYAAFKKEVFYRSLLELQQIRRQGKSLIALYLKKDILAYANVFFSLLKSPYVSFPTKFALIPFGAINLILNMPAAVVWLYKRFRCKSAATQ